MLNIHYSIRSYGKLQVGNVIDHQASHIWCVHAVHKFKIILFAADGIRFIVMMVCERIMRLYIVVDFADLSLSR